MIIKNGLKVFYYIKLMSNPVFHITDYINKYPELDTFRSEIYKKNILSKDYVDDKLFLIYHKFDQPSKTEIERECRSIIIDRESPRNIVSFSCETPLLNSQALEYILSHQHEEKIITKCYEGTLLSVFNHNNKWYVSTRRCLDSNESIWNGKSHFAMFMEVLNKSTTFDDFTNKLDVNQCYYFVLIHHQNNNIVDYTQDFGVEYKKLCLVSIKDKATQQELNLYDNVINFLDDNIFVGEKLNSLEEFDAYNKKEQFSLHPTGIEGIVIKVFDTKLNRYKLLKLQTTSYQFAKSIGSEKNIFMGLIHLYQNDKLTDFITQSPHLQKIVNPLNTYESFDTIGSIDSLFKVCTSELFELFKLLWDITNGKQMQNSLYSYLPKEYKTLLFNIRGLYYNKKHVLDNKQSASPKKHYLQIKDIYQYLKTISTENFCALLRMRKLMFNWVKVNTTISEFSQISSKCDKIHFKLVAIYTNKLFPNIMPDDYPPIITSTLTS